MKVLMQVESRIRPFQRISATRLNVQARCMRQYYYRYRRWYPEEDHPVLHLGHAVEAAILRALRPSPTAGHAAGLDTLLTWAAGHAAGVLPRELATQRESWQENPNRVGDWEAEVDPARCESMVRRFYSAPFHGREVERAYQGGTSDLLAAWAIARPRHTSPDAGPFAGQRTVPPGPDGWFTGAFDLWYLHGGASRIVDLKSSRRGSIFGTQYGDQLCAYAWMHQELEGCLPDAIELWYLGEKKPVPLTLPTREELEVYRARARALFELQADREEDYPAEPAPVEEHKGTWCDHCSFGALCPRTREVIAPEPGDRPLADVRRKGETVTVRGVVAGVTRSREARNGVAYQRIVLADRSGHRELTLFGEQIEEHLTEVRRGQVATVKGARTSLYRDTPGLQLGDRSRLELEA